MTDYEDRAVGGGTRIDSVRCPYGGKICFMTRQDAKRAMATMRRSQTRRGHGGHRRDVRDANLMAYECPKCHMWHVGHDRKVRP